MSEFRRRLMLQKGGIPYQQIEYLESTGTQIILTDYMPNPKTKFIAHIQILVNDNTNILSQSDLFGVSELNKCFSVNTGSPTVLNHPDATRLYIWNNIPYGKGGVIRNTKSFSINEFYLGGELILENNFFYFREETISLSIKTTINENPIALFGVNSLGNLVTFNKYNLRLKYVRIYEFDILVRDYIPVRIGEEGYLFDTISGNLFGNIGKGQFILGQDI